MTFNSAAHASRRRWQSAILLALCSLMLSLLINVIVDWQALVSLGIFLHYDSQIQLAQRAANLGALYVAMPVLLLTLPIARPYPKTSIAIIVLSILLITTYFDLVLGRRVATTSLWLTVLGAAWALVLASSTVIAIRAVDNRERAFFAAFATAAVTCSLIWAVVSGEYGLLVIGYCLIGAGALAGMCIAWMVRSRSLQGSLLGLSVGVGVAAALIAFAAAASA